MNLKSNYFMVIVCKYCKKSNNPTASYCVNCGKLLSDKSIKIVISKNEFDSLRRQKGLLEDRVRTLEILDKSRVEQIEKLQKDIDEDNNIKPGSSYSVTLRDVGAAKLQVVKAVKESIGLGLKEAKDYVDDAPSTIIDNVSKDEAERIKGEIEAAGAIVEIECIDGQQLLDNSYFDVFLTNVGVAKLQVVKTVKESLSLGLKEAKDAVDSAPSLLKTEISKADAERIKMNVEASGATVEIRQHIDSKLGYILIKTSEYNNLLSERKRILEEGYAPYGYHIEKDKQEPDLWMKKVKDVLNTNTPEITIKKSEYDNLKKRANMSLWDKLKESWGG